MLKKTGTCWVNIGDSYASGHRVTQTQQSIARYDQDLPLDYSPSRDCDEVLPKSLCGIPERFMLAMIDHSWICRNDIIWYKSNPMPESVKDRFTGTYEHVYFFVKNKKYWFEQQFEKANPLTQRDKPVNATEAQGNTSNGDRRINYEKARHIVYSRNKRDVWKINTEPFTYAMCLSCGHIFDSNPGAICPICNNKNWLSHFATFPEKLCEIPIRAGCPSMICTKCGKAREKILEVQKPPFKDSRTPGQHTPVGNGKIGGGALQVWINEHPPIDKGYSNCGCGEGWVSGIILDPFCGSGTVSAVAKKLGRKAIGIDLQPKYCDLTVKRLQEISLLMELKI